MATTGGMLLPLGPELRSHVYRYAGVCRHAMIDLNFGNRETTDQQSLSISTSLSLLLTCRLLHDEVEPMLYRDNVFVVSLSSPGGLLPLGQLSSVALRSMSSLLVRLLTCTCTKTPCPKAQPLHTTNSRSSPVTPSIEYWPRHLGRSLKLVSKKKNFNRRDQTALAQWTALCERLALHIVPGRLRLHLLLLPNNVELLETLLRPLEAFPRLADAAISVRSRTTTDTSLTKLTRSTVLRLTATDHDDGRPFRFLDLPFEIQRAILQLTELVSDDGHAHFSERGFVYLDGCKLHNDRLGQGGNGYHITGPRPDTPGFELTRLSDLFNPMRSSSYRSGCTCYRSDLGLPAAFLVSKAFAALSRAVFFGDNTFTIHLMTTQPYDMTRPVPVRPLGYEPNLGHFVRILKVGNALSSLRSICILLPPLHHHHLPPADTESAQGKTDFWPGWRASLDTLATHHTMLPALRLELRFTETNPWYPGDLDSGRGARDPGGEVAMWQVYSQIIAPLQRLRDQGLGSLFIYPVWPVCFSADEERHQWARRLERGVMGDDYDSDSLGKPARGCGGLPERWIQAKWSLYDQRIYAGGRWYTAWNGVPLPEPA